MGSIFHVFFAEHYNRVTMNLRKATLLLITGLVYILLYKGIKAVFPSFVDHPFVNGALSVLWICAALTIIVFLVYFIINVKPVVRPVEVTSYLVIAFTGMIIVYKLFYLLTLSDRILPTLIFKAIGWINSTAILVFLVFFRGSMQPVRLLKQAVNIAILAFIFGLIMNIISFTGNLYFSLTGQEISFLPKLHILAVAVFLFIYFATLHFLMQFRKVEDFTKLFRHE